MIADVARNPALLKLDLYCKGMRLDDSCLVEEDGGRKVLRTRAGLGSGLEVILPGGLWTNVPVSERFAQESPYLLRREQGAYWITRDGERVASVQLSPRPTWYDRQTATGRNMTRIGTLQGTYLGVYPAKVCEYWTEKPSRSNCKFCSVGLNLGFDDADEKSVDEVMEVVRVARRESGITYVDFNTGHYAGDTYLDIVEPFVRRIKRELGLTKGRISQLVADGLHARTDGITSLAVLLAAAGSWLVFREEAAGKPATAILPGIVAEALASLPVPRRMRWGSHDFEFVRPAHWLVMLLGEAVVPAEILGLPGGRLAARTRATCTASRPVPSLIWCRQEVPSATISASSSALRTAGSSAASAISIDTS